MDEIEDKVIKKALDDVIRGWKKNVEDEVMEVEEVVKQVVD